MKPRPGDPAAASDREAGFEVGDDFRRFSQKDDIFCRSFWDPEVRSDRSDMFYETYRTPRMTWRSADGFTQRDYALRNASWHVTDIFAELRGDADRREGFLDPYTAVREGPGSAVEVASPEEMAREVKRAARTLGADLVGITGYDERWTYTHAYSRETETEKPQEVTAELGNVIVIAQSMDRDLLRTAPSALSGAATGATYSRDTIVLLAIAQYITNLGYRAVASMNDAALAIPLAIKAGLGEYGRHGLLITREFGPRVRLGKVFTDLPLAHDRPVRFGVRETCEVCRACTDACPAKAIAGGEPSTGVHNRSNIQGIRKWTTDAEKCFRFWANQNTDCAICVRVCPYNRDYTRWTSRAWQWLAGTKLRRLALWLDRTSGRGGRLAPSRWWNAARQPYLIEDQRVTAPHAWRRDDEERASNHSHRPCSGAARLRRRDSTLGDVMEMGDQRRGLPTAAAVTILAWAACSPGEPPGDPSAGSYTDLETLFADWREFEAPDFVGGVPDYSEGTMAIRHAMLPTMRARLDALDPSDWPVARQIDWHLVRAEMNGLDFDHRVRRPWERDPAFYVMIHAAQSDVPAHEGAVIHGWIDLWTYDYPLSAEDAEELADRIGAIPAVLEQARVNLTGEAHDLWVAGLRTFRAQAADLDAFAERVAGTSQALDAAIAAARTATEEFHDWLESEAAMRTRPSGIGKEHYTWYMRNVHLVPFSWEEQVMLMRRELARAHSSLRLEEHRNRGLPELDRIQTAEEYDERLNASVTEYMTFLAEQEIHRVEAWMDPALRAKNGSFTPAAPGEIRNFFQEVNYRDPVVLRAHLHHWIELAAMVEEPHPSRVRSVPLLYNIWDARSEGLATGMEEMMMHAGLLDDKPRSRELVWIMLAQRAARALSGLYLHGNVFDMEEAVAHATEWTPRGWLPDAALVRNEQHLYLRQPGYGTSYLTGKIQIEELMGEWALQQGDAFTVQRFFDGFFASGVIPVVLTRWEMTGNIDELLLHR